MRKKTVQEMATGSTTTSTTGVSSVQGEQWLREILDYAKSKMFLEQFAQVHDLPQGQNTLHVPVQTSNLDFDLTTAESTARTMTQIDNITTVDITPSTKKLGASLSKDTMRTSSVDYMANIRKQLGYDAAVNIETDLDAAIVGEASPAASLYGGDATSTATLEASDVLTPDLVADAKTELRKKGWQNEPDAPFVLFIAPDNENALLKDSQFVNASEYGSNEVVNNGEVGKYLGVRVISSNFVTSSSTYGSGSNLDGHQCYMVKAKVAYGIVYGERPTFDFEYEKDEAMWKFYLDMAYGADSLQGDAIVHIYVVDA